MSAKASRKDLAEAGRKKLEEFRKAKAQGKSVGSPVKEAASPGAADAPPTVFSSPKVSAGQDVNQVAAGVVLEPAKAAFEAPIPVGISEPASPAPAYSNGSLATQIKLDAAAGMPQQLNSDMFLSGSANSALPNSAATTVNLDTIHAPESSTSYPWSSVPSRDQPSSVPAAIANPLALTSLPAAVPQSTSYSTAPTGTNWWSVPPKTDPVSTQQAPASNWWTAPSSSDSGVINHAVVGFTGNSSTVLSSYAPPASVDQEPSCSVKNVQEHPGGASNSSTSTTSNGYGTLPDKYLGATQTNAVTASTTLHISEPLPAAGHDLGIGSGADDSSAMLPVENAVMPPPATTKPIDHPSAASTMYSNYPLADQIVTTSMPEHPQNVAAATYGYANQPTSSAFKPVQPWETASTTLRHDVAPQEEVTMSAAVVPAASSYSWLSDSYLQPPQKEVPAAAPWLAASHVGANASGTSAGIASGASNSDSFLQSDGTAYSAAAADSRESTDHPATTPSTVNLYPDPAVGSSYHTGGYAQNVVPESQQGTLDAPQTASSWAPTLYDTAGDHAALSGSSYLQPVSADTTSATTHHVASSYSELSDSYLQAEAPGSSYAASSTQSMYGGLSGSYLQPAATSTTAATATSAQSVPNAYAALSDSYLHPVPVNDASSSVPSIATVHDSLSDSHLQPAPVSNTAVMPADSSTYPSLSASATESNIPPVANAYAALSDSYLNSDWPKSSVDLPTASVSQGPASSKSYSNGYAALSDSYLNQGQSQAAASSSMHTQQASATATTGSQPPALYRSSLDVPTVNPESPYNGYAKLSDSYAGQSAAAYTASQNYYGSNAYGHPSAPQPKPTQLDVPSHSSGGEFVNSTGSNQHSSNNAQQYDVPGNGWHFSATDQLYSQTNRTEAPQKQWEAKPTVTPPKPSKPSVVSRMFGLFGGGSKAATPVKPAVENNAVLDHRSTYDGNQTISHGAFVTEVAVPTAPPHLDVRTATVPLAGPSRDNTPLDMSSSFLNSDKHQQNYARLDEARKSGSFSSEWPVSATTATQDPRSEGSADLPVPANFDPLPDTPHLPYQTDTKRAWEPTTHSDPSYAPVYDSSINSHSASIGTWTPATSTAATENIKQTPGFEPTTLLKLSDASSYQAVGGSQGAPSTSAAASTVNQMPGFDPTTLHKFSDSYSFVPANDARSTVGSTWDKYQGKDFYSDNADSYASSFLGAEVLSPGRAGKSDIVLPEQLEEKPVIDQLDSKNHGDNAYGSSSDKGPARATASSAEPAFASFLSSRPANTQQFQALQEAIDQLTLQKLELERGLMQQARMNESLVTENSTMAEQYNAQGKVIAELREKVKRYEEELQAHRLALEGVAAERDSCRAGAQEAQSRASVLAAETVNLEQELLKLKSTKLRVERELEDLTAKSQKLEKTHAVVVKEKAEAIAAAEQFSNDKRNLLIKLRQTEVKLSMLAQSTPGLSTQLQELSSAIHSVGRCEVEVQTDEETWTAFLQQMTPENVEPEPAPQEDAAAPSLDLAIVSSSAPGQGAGYYPELASPRTIAWRRGAPSADIATRALLATAPSAPPMPETDLTDVIHQLSRWLPAGITAGAPTPAAELAEEEINYISSISGLVDELRQQLQASQDEIAQLRAFTQSLQSTNDQLLGKLGAQTQRYEYAVQQSYAYKGSPSPSPAHTQTPDAPTVQRHAAYLNGVDSPSASQAAGGGSPGRTSWVMALFRPQRDKKRMRHALL